MTHIILSEKVKSILEIANILQKEANHHNIIHVFDDGGYRELLLCEMFGLRKEPGRQGDNGIDKLTGDKYELKTVNLVDTSGIERKKPKITTCHHLYKDTIKRYRSVKGFLIGIFYLNDPARIYEVPSLALEEYFTNWEKQLNTKDHLNNPKFAFTKITKNKHSILRYHNPKYDSHFT